MVKATRRSSQLLRWCKSLYVEGRVILYEENRLSIAVNIIEDWVQEWPNRVDDAIQIRVLDELPRKCRGESDLEFINRFANLRLVLFTTREIDIATICHKLKHVCELKDVVLKFSNPDSLPRPAFAGLMQMKCNAPRVDDADEWQDLLPDLIKLIETERPLQSAIPIINKVYNMLPEIFLMDDAFPSIETIYPELWERFINSAPGFRLKEFAENKKRLADGLVRYLRAVELAVVQNQQSIFKANMDEFMDDLYRPLVEERKRRMTAATLDKDHDSLLTTAQGVEDVSKTIVKDLVDFRAHLATLRRRLPAIEQEIRALWDDELPSLTQL